MSEPVEPLRVGMVLFPNLTSLDLIGPFDVLNTPRCKIDLLWHRIEPVTVQGGFAIIPTATRIGREKLGL